MFTTKVDWGEVALCSLNCTDKTIIGKVFVTHVGAMMIFSGHQVGILPVLVKQRPVEESCMRSVAAVVAVVAAGRHFGKR